MAAAEVAAAGRAKHIMIYKNKITTITVEGIGPILLVRSKRAKHLYISVEVFRGVRVSVPYRVSLREAQEFVYRKTRWIIKHLDWTAQLEEKYRTRLKCIDEIDKDKAEETLLCRLSDKAVNNGFEYRKAYIRNLKTSWGTCSPKNNISLNIKLMRLPDELIDYVILHELVHTLIKSHGKRFWSELDRYVGNSKSFDRKLNDYKAAIL